MVTFRKRPFRLPVLHYAAWYRARLVHSGSSPRQSQVISGPGIATVRRVSSLDSSAVDGALNRLMSGGIRSSRSAPRLRMTPFSLQESVEAKIPMPGNAAQELDSQENWHPRLVDCFHSFGTGGERLLPAKLKVSCPTFRWVSCVFRVRQVWANCRHRDRGGEQEFVPATT